MKKKQWCWGICVGWLMSLSPQIYGAERVNLKGETHWDLGSDTLQVIQSEVDRKGIRHTRYVQRHQGIPVYGFHVMAHESEQPAGKARKTKGRLTRLQWTGDGVNHWESGLPKPRLGRAGLSSILDSLKAKYLRTLLVPRDAEPAFSQDFIQAVYFLDEAQQARLGYQVHFFVDGQGVGPHRPYFLLDETGENIVQEWDGLTFEKVGRGPGGNLNLGWYEYGRDREFLDVRVQNQRCSLENDRVRTVDLKNGMGFFEPAPVSFRCYRHTGDAVNGAYSPINDAHYYGSKVVSMYQDWYQLESPLDKNPALVRVHYGWNYENAFWNGSSMTFGDGAFRLHPLTTLSITGHELGHGVTEKYSGLLYFGQSGGLNESFSDMAGKAVEFYVNGQHSWLIGEEADKNQKGFRNMMHPEKDGHSIADARDYHIRLNVHWSSGVYNRAFYLLATMPGWDTRRAFDVFLAANQHYWTPLTDFANAGEGAIRAATDLAYPVEDLINALDQVGIECTEQPVCHIKARSSEDQ